MLKNLWSEASPVLNTTEELLQELQPHLPPHISREKLRRLLLCALLNLYAAWFNDPTRYVYYPRSAGSYKAKSRYNKHGITHEIGKVFDALEACDFVSQTLGSEVVGRVTRVRAEPRLTEIFETRFDPSVIRVSPGTECIVLRDKDEHGVKRDIEYDDTTETIRMREQLCPYNTLIAASDIDLSNEGHKLLKLIPRDQVAHVDFTRIFTRRVFNEKAWNKGGRFYGPWWQSLPKALRKYIRINGNKTVELDFSGFHLACLYHLRGVDYWRVDGKDPYLLPGYPQSYLLREILKIVLLTAINAENMVQAVSGVNNHLRENKIHREWMRTNKYKAKELILAFKNRHQPIGDLFFSGAGLDLQFMDSKVTEAIFNWSVENRTPVLGIHDSFIVEENRVHELWKLMEQFLKDAESKTCGIDCSKFIVKVEAIQNESVMSQIMNYTLPSYLYNAIHGPYDPEEDWEQYDGTNHGDYD